MSSDEKIVSLVELRHFIASGLIVFFTVFDSPLLAAQESSGLDYTLGLAVGVRNVEYKQTTSGGALLSPSQTARSFQASLREIFA